MTGPVTFSWCPATSDDWRAAPTREACIEAAKAEGIGEIFIQKIAKADPRWAIPTGDALIEKMRETAARIMPEAIAHGWLQDVPNAAVEMLSISVEHLVSQWLKDHGLEPDWTVVADMEAVVVE